MLSLSLHNELGLFVFVWWQKQSATFVFLIGGHQQNAGLLRKPISDTVLMVALILFSIVGFSTIFWLLKHSSAAIKKLYIK